MAISREVIERLAEMTRIGLSADETERLIADMASILTHVDRLQLVDTSHVAATSHVTGLHDVTRRDEIQSSMPVDDVLANAPESHQGFFVVPGVFGEP